MSRLSGLELFGIAIISALSVNVAAATMADDPVAVGQRIYEDGILSDGTALKGARWDNVVVSGAAASCALCHRTSGMGNVEGDIQAPPVTGNALFGTGDKVVATMDPRSGKAFNQAHEPYTEASLAIALRSGLHGDGDRMHVMMPRYELNETDMKALIAYMRQLSVVWSPGVTATNIRFATVITPDVPAERRAMFIDMMRKMVAQKNGSTAVAVGNRPRRHMAGAAEMVLGTERNWTLDVWELQGAPETWAAQLEELYARQPVFALMSGLGNDNWEPVGAFCDRMAVPCWFPIVDLPPAGASKYGIYFTRGVRLEADVLAAYLRGLGAKAPKRVVQVFRDDHVGRGAAQALTAALKGSGIAVQDRVVPAGESTSMEQAVGKTSANDALMLWLRSDDLVRLQGMSPPRAAVFVSAKLGGAESAPLPPAWKASARMIYPYEMPEKRLANLAYFRAWMNQRHIVQVDEMMQSEAYFAVSYLTDTVTEMLDNLYRDYLIERAESMISRREGSKAEAEFYSSTQSRVRLHDQPPGATVAGPVVANVPQRGARGALEQAGSAFRQREGTTAYPRLTLGPGQRFASKGGYVVHFGVGGAMVADSAWIVP